MGESKWYQAIEGPPKELSQYILEAHSDDRDAFERAVNNALDGGVDGWKLREKMAEVVRNHRDHGRWVALPSRRNRIAKLVKRLEDEWQELPRITADAETVALLDLLPGLAKKTQEVLDGLPLPWPQKPQGGRAPIQFHTAAVENIMSLGISEEDARAITRGLGIRTGRPRN